VAKITAAFKIDALITKVVYKLMYETQREQAKAKLFPN
jgi:hypothetical protein